MKVKKTNIKIIKTISVPSSLLECATEDAYLIRVSNSEYFFWCPKICVKLNGKKDQMVKISYYNDKIFTIFKSQWKNGGYTRTDVRSVNVAEFEKYFTDENIEDAA